MEPNIKQICNNHSLEYISSKPVSGGDINVAYMIETAKGKYFLKLNSLLRFPLMFKREAEGLTELHKSTNLKVPTIVATGQCNEQQYLLMEWVEKASPSLDFWNTFAEGLARLHRNTNTYFGWHSSNYIGSLVQPNNYSFGWAEFYATQRILPLTERLYNDGLFSKVDVYGAEELCNSFKNIFPNEPPSLLHGDLWAGNFMAVNIKNDKTVTPEVFPCIYDPAVYFGHREMDIGMSLLFGGFDSTFYDRYNEHFPLEVNWRKRVPLTQLYPLLVHAILFGGGYINQCRDIIKDWRG